ncbi:Thioredoxin [Sulfidibacter corallicola]|uniref:Uncharacterized protein n=1 Tax=Sulfidibacter corallicola TaxID=2818388 RepID=A0A8A4TXE4_SULCO|nr:thioredoxin family protein [Sulfidibacter corallicola]QTD51185.1 hypothetical protein J3U87_01840 [Sulfidibacter corallicola]
MTFCFDDKLFQRGQTWRECVMAWQTHRETFLDQLQQTTRLPKTSRKLTGFSPGTRMVVYYSIYKLDSWMSLPILGPVFGAQEHLEVRFHCAEHFFPVLGEPLGRCSPLVLLLDGEGSVVARWGPRPASVTKALEQMSNRAASDRDRWLARLDSVRFAGLLDEELAFFFTRAASESA